MKICVTLEIHGVPRAVVELAVDVLVYLLDRQGAQVAAAVTEEKEADDEPQAS